MEEVRRLRRTLAQQAVKHWEDKIPGLEETTHGLFVRSGCEKEAFIRSVVDTTYWGGELELVLLAWVTKTRLRVFRDKDNMWTKYAEYGVEGPVRRLLFDAQRRHYNLILLKKEMTSQKEKSSNRSTTRGYQETTEEINVDEVEDRISGDAAKAEEGFHSIDASRGSSDTLEVLLELAESKVSTEPQVLGQCKDGAPGLDFSTEEEQRTEPEMNQVGKQPAPPKKKVFGRLRRCG